MWQKLKDAGYFPIAWYFRFFASIMLFRWHPKIIVITGSSGKTTALHLIESQLGDIAKYSHHANSSFGIPFDILGLQRQDLTIIEWLGLFLLTPFKSFSSIPKQKIYIVEADCDRPGEGAFLSSMLKADILIWTNLSRTHAMRFERRSNHPWLDRQSTESRIAYEFGYFLTTVKEIAIINQDNKLIINQLDRAKKTVKILPITVNDLNDYQVSKKGSEFKINKKNYKFNYLLPKNVYYSIASCLQLCLYLKISVDPTFSKFISPPGRNTIFKGIKNTTIIDSSYNANYDSMEQILLMLNNIKSDNKWLVISDMLEQGEGEKTEHEKLAQLILNINADRILIMGPRMIKYVNPILENGLNHTGNKKIILEKFENPKQVLDFLLNNLSGEEIILFKGGRFLEGVIEHILIDKDDIKKLCRREKIWQIRRKQWGL